MGIRVLHTGDLHIGSFPGPEVNGENARYHDICHCLDALVAGAREQQPGIAVIAGDIFHQARVWSDRGLKEQQTAVKFLRELSSICPVVVMRGTPNHDSEQQFEMLKTAFEDNGEVKIITEPQVVRVFTGAHGWVQIACVPGFDRGYYRAQHPGLSKEEENEVFTKAVEDIIIGLKTQCVAEYGPTVLVSHYTITGCNMESGQTAFFSQFEPVVYPSTLAAADFDLVCFGHIHRPQQLDGCKNTFYCGAVSQLNFNDEGQERGYYIHEMGDNTDPDFPLPGDDKLREWQRVKSTFYPLPSREHLTIWLNDDDVRQLNELGPDRIVETTDGAEARDKIIRVLYNCTDEHNKAFNHGTLENWLRDVAGAFWVQEITPQKIAITVDRQSMEADGTPENNLADYLTEKGMEPERTGELIELARPIIAEATEKATQERRTGVFMPVEIEVKNYRNYREERFSFDDIRFCTINGSNGVGKSSLFMDAMLDALYEEPREGELIGWICNDPEARSGAIKFTFKLGDRLYRVTRTRQKSGKATLNIAEQVEGEWVDRSKEKFKDTQQEITNIIGMDSLTLKACALIMQDQYGLFLQADKEARMNILGSILGLGIYGGMEELAAEKATEANRDLRTLADTIGHLLDSLPNPEKLTEDIEATTEHRQRLEEQVKEKETSVDSLKVQLNTQIEAAGRAIRLNNKLSSLTAQIAAKRDAQTTQAGLVAAADTILSQEPDILTGIQQYNQLLEQEKELIKSKAEYDSLMAQHNQTATNIAASERTATEMRQKRDRLIVTKIKPLQQAITRTEELTEKHKEYEAAASRLAELESLAPEYETKKNHAKAAAEYAAQVDRDYEKWSSTFRYQISSLESKVSLLENSGCPNSEKATCKFLADALAAKAELPERKAEFEKLSQEYQKNRQIASDALKEAQEALGTSLYQPDKIEALRASQRLLAVSEREYSRLEAQRNELALMMERIAEIDKSITDTDILAEQMRASLTDIDRKLSAVSDADVKYSRLRQEILIAQQWTVKEKQLPAAREKKEAAAQRLLELDTELQDLAKEYAEAQAELALEQSKTLGREELQSRVTIAETEIRTLRAAVEETSLRLGGLQAQREQVTASLEQASELQQQANELGVKAAGYEELKKAFSQDGIPHNIIRSIIPVFEATATNILGQMSQGHMSVEFVTEKVLKSNAKKEVTTLDIIINDSDTGRLPYMSRSGGERVKAALSVILALSEIKSNKAGVQLGFLFIDEPPFLDSPGVQAYCDALEAIQQRYNGLKVMAITHDPAMKSRFPQSVDVVKTPEGSKVIYE